MADFAVIPKHTALVNVDIQNCFVESAPDGPAVVGSINNMGVLGELVPKVRAGLDEDAETAQFHRSLVIEPSDLLLEKPRFGAFYGTDLELILRGAGIDTVIVSGISTPVCCDTTAREANARDFRVLFLADGTACTGAEAAQMHQATLAVLDGLFAHVLTVDEVLEKVMVHRAAAAKADELELRSITL